MQQLLPDREDAAHVHDRQADLDDADADPVEDL